MAGIYEPFAGTVVARGRISPMFDISLGIDHEISGYDNIRLRGLILGLTPQEIERLMPDIAEFTELDDYLDIPVRTYSSGMKTRLTFAVATCFSPEILLMDEWIVAGDAGFLAKAQHRIQSFVERASILVLASHSIEICRKWCNKAVWLERGEIKMQGDIETVLAAYSEEVGVTA
jgi:ABC-2 type transport system ATP-binding protein/lipopolysaccharide transport system ATP-binding protein